MEKHTPNCADYVSRAYATVQHACLYQCTLTCCAYCSAWAEAEWAVTQQLGGDLRCGPNGAEHVKTRQCIQPGPVPHAIADNRTPQRDDL